MPRQRVIVSIGEALLCEYPDRVEPGGIAMAVTMAAARAGHRGFAVSRVGQDSAGDELLQQARAAGIDVEHVQSDPDLPTGRLITRSIAGKATRTLTANAAFDNLQWDFDMIDLAQKADAVVFGHLARRGGQTRSVIKQFLLECRGAMRVFDITNRAVDSIERSDVWTGLEFCEVLVTDEAALRTLAPAVASGGAGATAAPEATDAAAREVMRAAGAHVVIVSLRQGDRERLRGVSSSGESAELSAATEISRHEEVLMRVLGGLLDGQDLSASMRPAGA